MSSVHVYTSSTSTYSTTCHIQPETFPQQQSITMNALKCAPHFFEVNDAIVHLAPTQIQIYTELSGAAIADAIDDVAAEWTNVLSATGVSFTRVTSDCGGGGTCVKILQDVISGCAETGGNTQGDSSGEITSGAEVVLRNDWQTFTASSLRYALAHELGHYLGLEDQTGAGACSSDDSIMHDPIACTGNVASTGPTINDYLPVNHTTYGGGTRTSCGF